MAYGKKCRGQYEKISNYKLINREELEELDSLGLVFQHEKSGAKVIAIANEDDNKVFSIGFRTPPADSTGVAHIIEHSVLCGSRKFPSKDPFVELVKGSLNTFLNAMTYPDKTMYPVASCNEKDFQNLMDVYLDAVFYPNIYKKEEIFKQEGWHYELEKVDGELKYNGVVYNEMKGEFSSPDHMLARLIRKFLYPDTPYGLESGGDPEFIPDLTYSDFLAFHKKYYHPSNSYIYLYGDMDIEEKLTWLDQEYLSDFDKITVDSQIKMQTPFAAMREKEAYYPISEGESTENKAYLSYNVAIGTSLDRKLYLAFQVLDYALLDAPGAPLKQALIDAGIGEDIYSSYDNGMLQPYLSIIVKNSEAGKKDEFVQKIKDVLQDIINTGMEEKALKAAINYYEFKYLEADFGHYPKGLMYGIQILDSWLYDEEKPFIHIRAKDTFQFLKESIGTGYYEGLIKEHLLENTFATFVSLKPKAGLTLEREEKLKEKLSRKKSALSKEECQKLVEDAKNLRKYQEEPDSKEAIEKIPLLARADIGKKAQAIYNEEKEASGVKVLFHKVPTNGIAYIQILFDLKDIAEDKIPYLGLLSTVLGYVDTTEHSFLEYSNEVNIHTGGIFTSVNSYNKYGDPEEFVAEFVITAKVLYHEMDAAFSLIREMLFQTDMKSEKRMFDILQEVRSRLQMRLNSSGHVAALNRANSYHSKSGCFEDLTSGIGYYQFIKELAVDYKEKKENIIENLEQLIGLIFRRENMLFSVTSEEIGYAAFCRETEKFVKECSSSRLEPHPVELMPKAFNEGFKTSGEVQYVARTGNFIQAGYCYTGALKVLKLILNYDYLWINLRVKGGAYGCMSGFGYSGNGYLLSYRDPNIMETNEVYKLTADYIRSFSADERDMTKYIIGAVSGLDVPMTPSSKGSFSLAAYLAGITMEDLQRERDEVLSVDAAGIRALADLVQSILDAGNICVIGNEQIVEKNKELFQEVKNLM